MTTFNDLNPGDQFWYNSSLYLKVQETTIQIGEGKFVPINAACMNNGTYTQFLVNVDVKPRMTDWQWMESWLKAYEKEHPAFSAQDCMDWINCQPMTSG